MNNPDFNTELEFQEAIKNSEIALQNVPEDLDSLIKLGNLYADSGQLDNAELTYSKAANAYPNHFLPHVVLGKFYMDLEKDYEGEHALLKSFKLNPNDLETNVLLGNFCRITGKIDDAEKYYRQALAINPNDEYAKLNLRRVLSTKIPYWHFEMLADTERNDAFQKAIEKAVTKESVVLDIGTGSGLLAMMAARAGANQVIACELHSKLAETAKEITRLNGFEKAIKIFSKKSTKLEVGKELPVKADVVISEIIDVGVLGEAVIPSIRHAVQNLAKPGAKLIPAKVMLYGQLIEIPSRSKVAPIRKISGFDLSPFDKYRIPGEYIKINLKAEKHKVLSPIISLFEVDFYNLPPFYSAEKPRQIPLNISISENGNVQAIVFWFDLYLDEEIMVSSRQDGELEHWGQALFCFDKSKEMKKGEVLPVTLFQSDQSIWFKV